MRLVVIIVALAVASVALGEPPFLKTFQARYGPLKGALASASCQTCHTTPPQRQAFGKAVFEEMGRKQVQHLNDAVLEALEPADSDGDGWTNGDEIRAGFLPGDPTSHPSGTPASTPGTPAPPKAPIDFLPTHAFHPLVVHFPIAMFLFGVFLDVLGVRRADSSLRRLALWNIGFGAIASLAAVATGLTAFFQKGFGFEGLPFWHLLLGLTASACMLVAAAMKWRHPELSSPLYWTVITLGAVATTVAGHLGATIVFG